MTKLTICSFGGSILLVKSSPVGCSTSTVFITSGGSFLSSWVSGEIVVMMVGDIMLMARVA